MILSNGGYMKLKVVLEPADEMVLLFMCLPFPDACPKEKAKERP